ncbi:D-2-hydroxyacid dehydrogenase family protein [Paenibacillus hemerocallicola]|uniref:D-2-hydroxyacid dehydrogenase family protein n=1 Tax=Paenibacillus hemerocallicola TaxID=1172614 RepID=A0A5C4TIP7_9BACL|nr:D-2-hydroxyacid dehydrogenase family protein [Paenibacillus hemerocallicola]TNJ68309.1 D-2-hydroxyacid dehydrogenase family protein [Paenibacillus hemerocallicola]
MKLRCAILDDYQHVSLSMADWSTVSDSLDIQVFHRHFELEDELAAAIVHCEIVVIMRERTPFRESLFRRLPHLKLLVTTGMRNASVDLEAAARHGVAVSGTGGGGRGPAELTWALILGLTKHLIPENGSIRNNGTWQTRIGVDLYGKRLGLLGLGRIGGQVAQVGLAFGMEVVAWSPNLTEEKALAAGVRLAASKEELLESSDFVSIHLVLGERSRGLVGARELGLMRPTAYLINTSRAPIVDQDALREALSEGRIAGAGLDVFDIEPLPSDDLFRSLPNVLATPHVGFVTEESYRVFYRDIVQNIHAFLTGTPIRLLGS